MGVLANFIPKTLPSLLKAHQLPTANRLSCSFWNISARWHRTRNCLRTDDFQEMRFNWQTCPNDLATAAGHIDERYQIQNLSTQAVEIFNQSF